MAALDAVLEAYGGNGRKALLGFAAYLNEKQSFPEADKALAALTELLAVEEANDKSVGLVEMPVTVSPGAQRAFDNWVKAQADKPAVVEEEVEIPVGKKCVRNGCSNTYSGPESQEVTCVHHPGQAVFHETYKYWSCCERNKKYDFDDFRALPGCHEGTEKCAFTEAAAGIAKRAPCRHDFFQVGPSLTLNIYAKKVDSSKSKFFISSTQLFITVYFDGKEFNLNLDLAGKVDPSQCRVEIKEPKIEVSLKKGADGGVQGAAWETLGDAYRKLGLSRERGGGGVGGGSNGVGWGGGGGGGEFSPTVVPLRGGESGMESQLKEEEVAHVTFPWSVSARQMVVVGTNQQG